MLTRQIREAAGRSAIAIVVGVGISAGFVGLALLVVRTLASPPPGRPARLDPSDVVGKASDLVAIGTVTNLSDEVIDGTTVNLATFNAAGDEIARVSILVDSQGVFRIRRDEIPMGGGAAIIAAEAENHLSVKVNVAFRSIETTVTDTAGSPSTVTRELVELQPSRVHLRLKTFSPWLPLILFLPGFVGLLLAIAHLTGYARAGLRVSQFYAFGAAGLWGAILLWMVGIYVLQGHGLIRFFWDDLILPSGVVAAAFIGTMVYVAYSMHDKDPGFFVDAPTEVKRKLLLAIGGRILVAPYVAVIGHAIMATTFPSLNGGAFAAFFGFFTGLWIKPVLETLNDIGNRFLAPENRKAVVDRMSDRTLLAPAPAVTSASLLRADAVFVNAVEQARAQLLTLKNVIGVEGGTKVTAGELAAGRAIVVYVYEKDESVDPEDLVPPTVYGFPTDVVPLSPSSGPDGCRTTVFNLSWEKIHRDRVSVSGALPAASSASSDAQSDFVLLTGSSYFSPLGSQLFDVLGAYKDARAQLDDRYDFVAFCIDWKSYHNGGSFIVNNYYVPIFNNIAETNHYKGISLNDRGDWNTSRLLGCQVFSMELTVEKCLHEFAHAWCAYVTYDDTSHGNPQSMDLLMVKDRPPTKDDRQGLYHWGSQFDDGVSCVDHDKRRWLQAGQQFKKSSLADDEFGYCDLDLYLMGLMPKGDVRPFRVLRELREVDAVADPDLFNATPQILGIDDVIRVHGERALDNINRRFRQAFVMVSADETSARVAAMRARTTLNKFEARFSAAVGGRASVSTRR